MVEILKTLLLGVHKTGCNIKLLDREKKHLQHFLLLLTLIRLGFLRVVFSGERGINFVFFPFVNDFNKYLILYLIKYVWKTETAFDF